MKPNADGMEDWKLTSFSDSDWASDRENRKSISGFVLYLCRVPISWKNKAQKAPTLSLSEAEYVALSEAAKEVKFVVQLLESIGFKVKKPVKVRVDNVGAIYIAENPSTSQRTRHIDTRYHFVREMVNDEYIEIVFVKSENNLSDGFTKNISKESQQRHEETYLDKDKVDE